MVEKKKLTPVQEWRVANLEHLIQRYGTLASVARAADMSESYLNQIRNRFRGMGHRTAANLEKGLDLPEGSLSMAPATHEIREEPNDYGTDNAKLKRVIEAWGSLTKSQQESIVRNIDDLERANQELLSDLLERKNAS